MYIRALFGVAWPDLGGWGSYKMVLEKQKQRYSGLGSVTRQRLKVGDVTKWYQSHGFNTEPG
jgi:hypothetical protein